MSTILEAHSAFPDMWQTGESKLKGREEKKLTRPMVTNIGSFPTVPSATQKPASVGSPLPGNFSILSIVLVAAGARSSQQNPIQSCKGLFVARVAESDVWAMTPGDGSEKIRLVIAWRKRRRRLVRVRFAETPESEGSRSLKVVVLPSGNALWMP